MKGVEIRGFALLAALTVAPMTAPLPSAPGGAPRAVSVSPASRVHKLADSTRDRRRPAPAPSSEQERDAAFLLMLGDAAAHWRLR
jgi:hypothetical protein